MKGRAVGVGSRGAMSLSLWAPRVSCNTRQKCSLSGGGDKVEKGWLYNGRQTRESTGTLAGRTGYCKSQAGREKRRRKLPDEIVADRGKRAYGCRCLFAPQLRLVFASSSSRPPSTVKAALSTSFPSPKDTEILSFI